jgi:hypothetical protein
VLAGHRLPRDEVREAVVSFLTEHVGSACGVSRPKRCPQKLKITASSYLYSPRC